MIVWLTLAAFCYLTSFWKQVCNHKLGYCLSVALICLFSYYFLSLGHQFNNKTLGRALYPCVTSTWLSKLSELNMYLSMEDRELIRRAREARENEETEKRGLTKGVERGQRKEKETKRQFEDKEGLRESPFFKFSRSSPAM